MDNHGEFTEWAVARGVKVNGIAAHRFAGRGLGIIAEKKFEAGDILVSVPTSALRTLLTVPKSISKPIGSITVHGLLAAELALDTREFYASWRAVLPRASDFTESLPLLWDTRIQDLLPQASKSLLSKQKTKLATDWLTVSSAFPSLSYEHYVYHWLLVNTRTFYFTSLLISLPKPINRDDCMALNPFADYFNHSSSPSASASFSSNGYVINASVHIEKGDEIYISYGNHSNDFLLVEYGFTLDTNQWDEVSLDQWLLELFDKKQQEVLGEAGFKGKYVLDAEGVCYRTKVAVRLLCMPVNKWRRLVSVGLEDGDRFQSAVDEILTKVLKSFAKDVCRKIESVKSLDCGLPYQRETLSRRWHQIRALLETAMERSDSKA